MTSGVIRFQASELELAPDDYEIRASLIYALHFAAGSNRAEILAHTQKWNARVTRRRSDRRGGPHSNTRDPDRRLRVF